MQIKELESRIKELESQLMEVSVKADSNRETMESAFGMYDDDILRLKQDVERHEQHLLPPLPNADHPWILCVQKGVMSWQPIAIAEAEIEEDTGMPDPPKGAKWYHIFLPGRRSPVQK